MSPKVKSALLAGGLAAVVAGSAAAGTSADSATHFWGKQPPGVAWYYRAAPQTYFHGSGVLRLYYRG